MQIPYTQVDALTHRATAPIASPELPRYLIHRRQVLQLTFTKRDISAVLQPILAPFTLPALGNYHGPSEIRQAAGWKCDRCASTFQRLDHLQRQLRVRCVCAVVICILT